MFFKILVLVLAMIVQARVILSQVQYPQQGGQQMFNPYDWAMPYYQAASTAWIEYMQKAQEASKQLYQQWDKTGAGNLYSIGMGFAQQAAKDAQKFAEEYMKKTQAGVV